MFLDSFKIACYDIKMHEHSTMCLLPYFMRTFAVGTLTTLLFLIENHFIWAQNKKFSEGINVFAASEKLRKDQRF